MTAELRYNLPNSRHMMPWRTLVVATLLFICLFAFYAICYQYHFYWQEQNQLYLCTAHWLRSYFDKPAWLASMAGEWLTQYYYYVYAGPAILAAVLALTVVLLYGALKPALPRWLCLLLTTVSALWLIGSSFDSSCRLDSLLSVLCAVAAYRIVRPLKLWVLVFLPLVYWAFGYGVIIMGALCIIGSLKQRPVIIATTVGLTAALVAITPYVLNDRYQLRYKQALLFPPLPRPTWPEWEAEDTLAVENEYYFGNYAKTIDKALSIKEPNLETAFYYYLSQAKRDSLPDYLLSYPLRDLGTLNAIGEESPMAVINMMNDLYYELGDMMYAERAAMMRAVFARRNRNARMVKRLAEVNLVSGDTLAALKYLGILDKTKVYKSWAEARQPAHMAQGVEADVRRRRQLMNTQDTLRLGDNCRTILVELINSNPRNTMALDYLLCTDLLLKDIEAFKADYDRYGSGKSCQRRLYQQALMIYLAGTEAPPTEWDRYIVDRVEFERFKAYDRERGSEEFSDTYWYYFDKAER